MLARSPRTPARQRPTRDPPRRARGAARALRRGLTLIAALVCGCLLSATYAGAQSLEPRSYSNTPVGLNFLIGAYAHSQGSVAFDPSVPLTDAKLRLDTEAIGYSHTLDVWSRSAKIEAALPLVSLSGSALVPSGERRSRDISGLGDPVIKFAVNFYGAPAMSLKEFQGYHQDLIVGGSLRITAPYGQYDDTKLVNIGSNRWSFKPELGLSKALGPWTLDLYNAVTFYTENSDFYNGGTVEQDPIYSAQAHVMRNLTHGIWLAVDGTFYWGGRTTVNGRRTATLQAASRFGATLALPLSRYLSLKLYGAEGTSSRTHSNFNDYGIGLQCRWGAGL